MVDSPCNKVLEMSAMVGCCHYFSGVRGSLPNACPMVTAPFDAWLRCFHEVYMMVMGIYRSLFLSFFTSFFA